MKRSVTEVIRRGFENVIANWPLLLIKIAETVLFFIIVIVAILAAIVPLALSIGFNKADFSRVDNPPEFLLTLLAQHWPVLVYLVLIVTAVVTVMIALHSFFEAAAARVYVDAEALAQSVPSPSRAQLRAFTTERWMAGGKRSWWPVFWIYNIAWGVASMIILLPLIALAAGLLLLRDSPPAMAVLGCGGGALFFLFAIVVSVVTAVWSMKAIVVCVARAYGAMESLRASWQEFKSDAGRHIAVTLILYLLMIIGVMLFGSISAFTNLNDSPGFQLTMMPLQITSSFLQSIFSGAMGGWFLACFAAMTVEPRAR